MRGFGNSEGGSRNTGTCHQQLAVSGALLTQTPARGHTLLLHALTPTLTPAHTYTPNVHTYPPPHTQVCTCAGASSTTSPRPSIASLGGHVRKFSPMATLVGGVTFLRGL